MNKNTSPRKAISKRIRFEVFKRDSFTCQYCGRSAPEILLEIDHIKPVSKGGDNNIINLVTSCKDCNAGKSDRELSEQAEVQKQISQLEELNERRNQLEMMMQWRDGLLNLKNAELGMVAKAWSEACHGWTLNEKGLAKAKELIKKCGVNNVLDAIEDATNKFLQTKNGKATQESVELSWNYTIRYSYVKKASEGKPWMKDVFLLRGLVKKWFWDGVCDWEVKKLLERAVSIHEGQDNDTIRSLISSCGSYRRFIYKIDDYIRDNSI